MQHFSFLLFFLCFYVCTSLSDDGLHQKNIRDLNYETDLDSHAKLFYTPTANSTANVMPSFSQNATEEVSWGEGAWKSAITIFAAEFGDKTFFVNWILAMSHNVFIVTCGIIVAVLLSNVVSCLLGLILPTFLSRNVTLIIAAVLFCIFGIVMIVKGCKGDDDEKEEAEEEIKKDRKCSWFYSGVFLQTFALNFFAELGDTSQITTILLASNYQVMSVYVGSSVGNILCSLIAVIGGKLLEGCFKSQWISIIGGTVFLIFAAETIFIELPQAFLVCRKQF